MSEPAPPPLPPASKPKRVATIVWAVVILALMACFCGAIAGPKFASFNRRSPQPVVVPPDDAGP